jgi:hypothetical protein
MNEYSCRVQIYVALSWPPAGEPEDEFVDLFLQKRNGTRFNFPRGN